MARQAGAALYVLALVATVVSADVLFFRHHFTARLIANVVIVLAFGSFYLIFLARHQRGGRDSRGDGPPG